MKDMLTYLERLRSDAAECALIRDLSTNPKKRELFERLTEHLNMLADHVEDAIVKWDGNAFLDRKTQEPFPNAETLVGAPR